MVELDCLKVVHLLNDKSTKSFFTNEIKSMRTGLEAISFIHMKHYYNFLTHFLAKRASEEQTSSLSLTKSLFRYYPMR